MSAGGMAGHDQRLTEPRQLARGLPHLADDPVNADVGTEIVARDRNADPERIEAGSEMTGRRAVERLPVATVNKDNDRAVIGAGEKIDDMAHARPIAHHLRRMPLAIFSRIPGPAGHDGRIFRNPRPVVVFDLIVDIRAQDATRPFFARTSAPTPWSWPIAASIRERPWGPDPRIYRRSRSRARRPSCENRRGRSWSAVSPGRGGRCRRCGGRDGLTQPGARPAR